MGKLKIVILLFAGALLFVIGSSQIALSVVIYDETIDGDFPFSPGDLSNIIVLNVGTNTILGTTTYYYSGPDDNDAIKFTIPEGMSLSEIDISLFNSGTGTVTNYTLSLYSFDSTSTISTWESGSPPVSNNSAFSDVLPLPPGNYAISDTDIFYNNFSEGQEAELNYTIDINVESSSCDIDGNGVADALSDGVLIIRYLFGSRGVPLINGVVDPAGTRTTAPEIEAFLADGVSSLLLDIDGNGVADALSDGVLIIRYLFGSRGVPLINGVVDPAGTRTTAPEIEAYILSIL